MLLAGTFDENRDMVWLPEYIKNVMAFSRDLNADLVGCASPELSRYGTINHTCNIDILNGLL